MPAHPPSRLQRAARTALLLAALSVAGMAVSAVLNALFAAVTVDTSTYERGWLLRSALYLHAIVPIGVAAGAAAHWSGLMRAASHSP